MVVLPTKRQCLITKTRSCNIQKFFCCCKNENFHWKIFDIFLIFAQNIDGGYTVEPLWRGGSSPRRFYRVPTIYGLEQNIEKIGILLCPPVLLDKSGVQGDKHFTDMFSWYDGHSIVAAEANVTATDLA